MIASNVNNIIDRDEGQEIAMQTSSELEPEVESGWALNISDNPVLNSNNYYNVYGKTYTPPQGGIDIFKDPAAAYDAWVRELTIRSAPVEKGGLGEIQEGTGTYPFIVGVSPIQYWIERAPSGITVNVWAVPDSAQTWTLGYYYMERVEDTGSPASLNMDVPARFLPCLTAGLAYMIAIKKPQAESRIPFLKQDYEEQWTMASDSAREKASLYVVPGGYQYL